MPEVLTWTQRARRRGAGTILFRPPSDLVTYMLWHDVETHLGPMRLQWRPGIDIWRDADGQRWTAEFAGEMQWVYRGLSEPEAA